MKPRKWCWAHNQAFAFFGGVPNEWCRQLLLLLRCTISCIHAVVNYPLKAARFPIHRNLISFDWQETPLQRARIEQLASAGFMDQAYNLILVGGTGTGKTHLATASAVAAIHQGKRVRFYNAVDLVNPLDKEEKPGKAGNLAKQLTHMDAVILDELGYLPFPDSGGAFCSLSLANCTKKLH